MGRARDTETILCRGTGCRKAATFVLVAFDQAGYPHLIFPCCATHGKQSLRLARAEQTDVRQYSFQ